MNTIKTYQAYWRECDKADLETAMSYTDLSKIAMRIIDRMGNEIGQVCGPISTGGLGSIEANLERFSFVIHRLKESGHVIFDQMPFEDAMQRIKTAHKRKGYDEQLLNDFYLPIFESGHVACVYFIPGWESSKGAVWEHEVAERLGIQISYLTDTWINKSKTTEM